MIRFLMFSALFISALASAPLAHSFSTRKVEITAYTLTKSGTLRPLSETIKGTLKWGDFWQITEQGELIEQKICILSIADRFENRASFFCTQVDENQLQLTPRHANRLATLMIGKPVKNAKISINLRLSTADLVAWGIVDIPLVLGAPILAPLAGAPMITGAIDSANIWYQVDGSADAKMGSLQFIDRDTVLGMKFKRGKDQ